MSVAAQVKADSPLVYWPLDEASGTTAVDASGNGNHGTYTGSPTLGQQVGQFVAPLFDNVDDLVSAAVASYTLAAWECWFRTTAAVTPASTIGCLLSGATTDPHLWLGGGVTGSYSNEVVTMTRSSSSGSWAYDSAGASIAANAWHHIAARWDSGGSVYQLLLDGTDVRNGSAGSQTQVTATNLRAGRDGGGTVFFGGRIAHVALYTSAPSVARFAAHYAAGLRAGVSY